MNIQFDIIKQSPPKNFDDYEDIEQFYVYYVENTKIRLGCKYLLKDGTWKYYAEVGDEYDYCELYDSENELKEYFISILSNHELMWRFYD